MAPAAGAVQADAESADRDYVMGAESEADDEATLEEEELKAQLAGEDAQVCSVVART